MSKDAAGTIIVGRIGAPHGVRGWVKLTSFTDPPENLLSYHPLLLGDALVPVRFAQVQRRGKAFIAQLEGCEDRDAAEALRGRMLHLPETALPEAEAGEFYWQQLIGLQVENASAQVLGKVVRIMETGAHDVLVLDGPKGEVLVPFTEPYLIEVALEQGRIRVDWELEWL